MIQKNDLETFIKNTVDELNNKDLTNESKKRTAVAKVNEYLNQNNIQVGNYSNIEKLIEGEIK